jgi:flagellar biosynthesis protein FlhG
VGVIASAEIWAVGGGKGGTGKSFITCNMACSLAAKGSRVVLIDADLGGANLHSFLGIKRPRKTLTDFFEKKMQLEDVIVETGVEGLGLITGDLQSLDSGGIKPTQRQKLFRHMKEIEADYIIMDLGAGSHNTTLDFFLQADRMIVVTMPAITALENLYHFIKNVYYRNLKVSFGKRGMKDLVTETWKNRDHHGIKTLKDLVKQLKERSGDGVFDDTLEGFNLNVVLNQVRSADDIHLGGAVKSVIRKYLGFMAEYAGYVRTDEAVLSSLNEGIPFVHKYPASRCVKDIEQTVLNIATGGRIREVVF